jgi:hypothetical protein
LTAAEDRREDLEAVIRRQLTNITKRPHTANECTDAILKAADAYAKAPRAPEKPPEPKKPPAVHYAPLNGYAACRPYYTRSTQSWAVSADPQVVTCGTCRKTPAWREAAEAS